MAMFIVSTSIAAGAQINPIDLAGNRWKYTYVPYDCIVEILQRATAVGLVCSVTSGSDEIMQQSNVPAGGTAGVTPARLDVEPITFKAKSGDMIMPTVRNTAVGAVTYDMSIELTRV